tara:strand:+ start:485 stop:841 length:357 start_codon:yes stop_codon:yes gene_type:complete
MLVINDKNNMCRTAVKYKERSSGTKQLELNFLGDMGSHNIYFSESAKRSKRVHKLNQPKRTVRFNKLGCLDSLTISLKNLKSFYKDESGTYIEVAGVNQPIAVRDSIYEIKRMINKEQ